MKLSKSYKPLLKDNSRFIVIKGGAGSGKSYSMAQIIVLDCVQNETKWLCLRKVGATIKESIFSIIKDVIYQEGLGDDFRINKTDKSFEYIPNGSVILTSGLDDPEKIKSIHGIQKIWMEEATEFMLDDFKQLNLRLRGQGFKKQYYLTFNPIDASHWIKGYFYDNKPDDCTHYTTTYKDNLKFLDAEYIHELEDLINRDQYYYDVYTLGKWGVLSKALVFSNLYIHEFDNMQWQNERHGMDFGFNHASTLMSCGMHDGELYIYDEIYCKNKTNMEFINIIKESGFNINNRITADSAEPDRIKEFNQYGFKISSAVKGKDSVKRVIDFLKTFKSIHIHKTKCPNAAREFQSFKYRELKDGTLVEEFVEFNDDTVAGVRYAIEDIAKMLQKDVKATMSLGR